MCISKICGIKKTIREINQKKKKKLKEREAYVRRASNTWIIWVNRLVDNLGSTLVKE